jgi:ZIP family zinc transporter
MTGFWRGLIYSSVAGISTVLGAIPFLLFNKVASQKLIDAFLGFAAGVMLAASAFSLVVPSIELGGVRESGQTRK